MAANSETSAEAGTSASAERRVVHLDDENPWPSLDSFTENAALFFKGRDAENQDLQRRITRRMLTVLFGVSGLGKTSLLEAGVFPCLREEGFMPVRIRLDHTSSLRNDLVEQVRVELRKALDGARYYAPRGIGPKESLWAYFHQPELEIRDRDMDDRVVKTVLVFDQFEEIFSHGQGDPSHEWAQRALIEELAQLIDNRVPPDLKRELERDPAAVRRYDFDNQDYRIVLSLREDYLPHLESLYWQISSITENRFRLLAMNEEQAFEAVKEPGKKIVDPPVARQIVEFAAGESQGAALPGAPASVQRASSVSPALLSLICSELNDDRKRPNAAKITAEQVRNSAGQILQHFYDRCFEGLPHSDKVREVVEGNLVSGDNYREKISLSTVLSWLQQKTHCTSEEAQQTFERLRDRRLVQFDSREGRTTIELTHDVLCVPAAKSRQARLERLALARAEKARLEEKEKADRRVEAERKAREDAEARGRIERRRARKVVMTVSAALVFALAAAIYGLVQYSIAEAAKRRAEAALAVATQLKISWRGVSEAPQKLDLALLLNTEAVRGSQATMEARNALLTSLLSSPHLKTFLRGHTTTVRALAFSRDGILASADAVGNIFFWDPSTGYMTQAPHLKAHNGYIFSIAFSPDGKNLASASSDHTIKIWNLVSSTEIALSGHSDAVRGVAFSIDGTRLASAGADGTAKIWDVPTGKELKSLKGHDKAVSTVAFSADNQWLASAGDDRKIILWDPKTYEKKKTIEVAENESPIFKTLFSRDSKTILAASATGVITGWDVQTGQRSSEPYWNHTRGVYGMDLSEKQLASVSQDRTVKLRDMPIDYNGVETLMGHREEAYSVAFRSDGQMLAAGFADGVIAVWDFSTLPGLAHSIDDVAGELNNIALDPRGKILAVAQGNTVVLWDVEEGSWLGLGLPKTALNVECVAISPDGKIVASGSEDGIVRLWEAATGKQIGRVLTGHTAPVWSVAFSHDGKTLASGSSDNTVRLWDVGSRKFRILNGHRGPVSSLSFSPDNTQLASGSHDGTIRRWEVETGKEIGQPLINPNGKVYRVAFGTQALACANFASGITLWDFSSAERQPRQLATKTAFSSVAFARDGRTLLSISAVDGSITRWNASKGNALQTVPKEGSWSQPKAAFSEVAMHAAVVSKGKILVTEPVSGTRFGQTIDTNPEVLDIEVSHDGDTIAIARASGRVSLLDGKTFQPKGKPWQHPFGLSAVASSPTNDIIACAGGNHIVLREIKTGRELRQIDVDATTTCIAFSRDGKRFAAGDEKGNVRLWDSKSFYELNVPVEAHKNPVVDLAFHPTGDRLLSTDGVDFIAQSLSGDQSPKRFESANITQIAVSPDGRHIAFGTRDGHVELIDADSGKPIATLDVEQSGTTGSFTKSNQSIEQLVFSEDSKLLASSSVGNEAVVLWDVENRHQFGLPLTGYPLETGALRFTPDGKYLLTADKSGKLLRWDMNVEGWQKLASTIAGRKLTKEESEQYMGDEPYEPFPDAWLALKEAVNASLASDPKEKVEDAFKEAVKTAKQSNDPEVNNAVCWVGTVRGFAPIVLSAGQRSVELARRSDEKNVGYYQDTLALALALTKHRETAIENFKAFVQWAENHSIDDDTVAKRKEWIHKLEDGEDPFTPETLKELLKESVSLD